MLLDDFEDMISVMQYEYKPEVVKQYFTAKLKEFGERLKRPDIDVAGAENQDRAMYLHKIKPGYDTRNAELLYDVDKILAELERTTHAGSN